MSNSSILVHSTTAVENQNQHKSKHNTSRFNLVKSGYKILLDKHKISPYSFMLVKVQREKGQHNHGDFVADIDFFSSDSGLVKKDITSIEERQLAEVIGKHSFKRFRIRSESKFVMDIMRNREQKGQHNHGDFVADIDFYSSDSGLVIKDITSIEERQLAEVIGKYRIFVDCIKTEEQKELSDRSKDMTGERSIQSIVQRFAKVMIANSAYMKNATLTTIKIKKVISELSNLRNSSLNRDIYTNIDISGTRVSTRSTIELDADIVNVIQKQPEVKSPIIRNFILNIHISNMSLSTFFSLNNVNQIFSNCGMMIGFSRMATTPFSIYSSYSFILADPLSILALVASNPFPVVNIAVPAGLFILIPRIARFIIRRNIRKKFLLIPKVSGSRLR
jgi:hypothetical protein